MDLKHTRAVIDAIHSGELAKAPTVPDPWFGFDVPQQCPGVPDAILTPRNVWSDQEAYDRTAANLAERFRKNFQKYADGASAELLNAGPKPA
jgi:phosphoenolpyruvate carboxykinase (ATP)